MIRLRLILLALTLVTAAFAADAPPRPNIIIILADDVGFSDIGCFGSEIATPHLDALAAGGVRLTQFYNASRCCPTRASLLTGLYPHQAGVGHMVDSAGSDAYRGELSPRTVTIAEALKASGYRTYGVGKWHVTPFKTAELLKNQSNWPRQRGFDRHYGTLAGSGSFFDPVALERDNQLITAANDPEYQPAEYYYTDAITDNAMRYLSDHARDHALEPFFMYVAYTAAHWPLHAREADIAKYKGRYDAGYQAIRDERLARLKKLGLVDPRWEMAATAGDWAKVPDRAFEARCMEVYAAQLDRMDQGIGRIVAELKANGQFENTLILFLQDNGGCAEPVGRTGPFVPRAAAPAHPPKAKDAMNYGSGPAPQTRDGWPVRQGYGVMPGPEDTFIAYGRDWANVSDTPFREYKHWVHEGGIATPLIAHWPAGIAARLNGRLENQPGHLIDLMATCVDLAGAKYPTQAHGENIPPMEGVSLRPAFAGEPLRRTAPIFWEHEGSRAIRDGQWKLVSKYPDGWELFDMAVDRTEQHDLAAQSPDRVKAMSAQWAAWAARVGVRPWPEVQRAENVKSLVPATSP
ncbi:MAG: arylsulfatase [Lacunisphaera sp.]|nr:arylsulfatase [Lacunisphaera sp.]